MVKFCSLENNISFWEKQYIIPAKFGHASFLIRDARKSYVKSLTKHPTARDQFWLKTTAHATNHNASKHMTRDTQRFDWLATKKPRWTRTSTRYKTQRTDEHCGISKADKINWRALLRTQFQDTLLGGSYHTLVIPILITIQEFSSVHKSIWYERISWLLTRPVAVFFCWRANQRLWVKMQWLIRVNMTWKLIWNRWRDMTAKLWTLILNLSLMNCEESGITTMRNINLEILSAACWGILEYSILQMYL